MTIVKKFEIEMAHIVRNAWSERCSKSVHGHTYTIEVALRRNDEAMELHDSGRMVVDFGEVKKYINPFIDSFDHAMLLWSEDKPEVIDFFRNEFDRVIVCPESSSCEMMSAVFFVAIQRILENTPALKDVALDEVIVHETRTGRAHCQEWSEWVQLVEENEIVENTWFSPEITREWPQEMVELSLDGKVGTLWIDVQQPLNFVPLDEADLTDCVNPCCEQSCGVGGVMDVPDLPVEKPSPSTNLFHIIMSDVIANDMWCDFFGRKPDEER